MILWLEVNEIGNVIGSCALSLTRVAQTRSRSTNRFFLATQPITIERAHFEVFEKQRRAIVFLPLPVVDRRQRRSKTIFVCRNSGVSTILKRQWRCLCFARQTAFDQRPK